MKLQPDPRPAPRPNDEHTGLCRDVIHTDLSVCYILTLVDELSLVTQNQKSLAGKYSNKHSIYDIQSEYLHNTAE